MNNDKKKKIVVVMMGGDGSLMNWLMSVDKSVDINSLYYVALPYGTGNDFCNVTNWGKLPN